MPRPLVVLLPKHCIQCRRHVLVCFEHLQAMTSVSIVGHDIPSGRQSVMALSFVWNALGDIGVLEFRYAPCCEQTSPACQLSCLFSDNIYFSRLAIDFYCSFHCHGSLVPRTSPWHAGRRKLSTGSVFRTSRYEGHARQTIQDQGGSIL